MVRSQSVYGGAAFVWVALVLVGGAAVVNDLAAPAVTVSSFPSGTLGLVGAMVGLVAVGLAAIGLAKRRAWHRAGRQAGLEPEGGGLLGTPDLVGTDAGRTVRARTVSRTNLGGGTSNNSSTYTVVEADLQDAGGEGLVVSVRGGDAWTEVASANPDLARRSSDGIDVVASTPALAAEPLTASARAALGATDRVETVYVGAAESLAPADAPVDVIGDAATARTESSGVLLDGDELANQVAAVSALAEGFQASHGTREGTTDATQARP